MLRLAEKEDVDAHRRLITSSTSLKTSSQFWPLLYPGAKLTKLRHRLRPVLGIPLSVDEFQANLKGLVIAEAEFDNPEKLARFAMPDFAVREVTAVLFFTGVYLARNGLSKD